jgi:hypothetical protein
MQTSLEDRMFEIATTAFTSCPVILDEPPIMATTRVLVIVDRLIAALEAHGLADPFLTEARLDLLDHSALMMSEPARYTAWLDEIAMRFTAEAKRRNAGADVSSPGSPETGDGLPAR